MNISGILDCITSIVQTGSSMNWFLSCINFSNDPLQGLMQGSIDTSSGAFTVSGSGAFGITFTGQVSQGIRFTASDGVFTLTGNRIKSAPVGDCSSNFLEFACDIPVNSTATIRVLLNALNLPDIDEDGKAGYRGIQVRLKAGTGGSFADRPGTAEIVWPDCDPASAGEVVQGGYLVFCLANLASNESVYVGSIVEVDFVCSDLPRAVTVELVMGIPLDTHLLDEDGVEVLPSQSADVIINCVLPNLPTPTPSPDPTLDSDADGCTDQQEQGSNPIDGGQRDPNNFWDFFDTPNPNANPMRDKAVSAGDIFRIVARIGAERDPPLTKAEALAEALTVPPAAPAYHASFDRSFVEGKVSGPPDGFIGAADIFLAVLQFGHNCIAS